MKYILDINDPRIRQALFDLGLDPQQLLIR
jgi:hypothetical protein